MDGIELTSLTKLVLSNIPYGDDIQLPQLSLLPKLEEFVYDGHSSLSLAAMESLMAPPGSAKRSKKKGAAIEAKSNDVITVLPLLKRWCATFVMTDTRMILSRYFTHQCLPRLQHWQYHNSLYDLLTTYGTWPYDVTDMTRVTIVETPPLVTSLVVGIPIVISGADVATAINRALPHLRHIRALVYASSITHVRHAFQSIRDHGGRVSLLGVPDHHMVTEPSSSSSAI